MGNELELSTPVVQLTIGEAKHFVESHIHTGKSKIELREDSVEVLSPEGFIQPDWNLAQSYYDSTKMQAIVEVPLKGSRLSRTLLNPENVQVDTATFFSFAVNHRLIVVRNADNIIDFAVMKIEGTYQYNLTRPDYSSRNSYKAMDPQFWGLSNMWMSLTI